jgi:flagella basal body P-ring formation protein FlgA
MVGDFKYNPIKLNWTNSSVTVSERRGSGKGKLLLELNFANQKREEKKIFLSVPLLEAKPVVFIKLNHFSGDVLTEENLLSGVKWLPYGETGFISELSSAIGKKLNRNISEMMALKKNMIESVPILHKGDPVTIFLETGGILITAKGVAKEDALAGDLIKVLNWQSKKTIQAHVISSEAVRIDF